MNLRHPTMSSYFPMDYDRPPHSYKELIIKAFELVRSKPLELRDIYFLISGIFPYYKPGGAWQNAVRHVLVLDPTFASDPRTNLWQIVSNVELQTSLFYPSRSSVNARGFGNQHPISESSLLNNRLAPSSPHKGSYFNGNIESTHNSDVHSISFHSANEPQMSSLETSYRWIDPYSGMNLPEVSKWPSNTYMSSLNDDQQSTPREMHRDLQYFSQRKSEPVKPVRPNAIKSYSPDYKHSSTFKPYSPNQTPNVFMRKFTEENILSTHAGLNIPIKGAFNRYNVPQNSYETKNFKEETNSNSLSSFISQNVQGSVSPLSSNLPHTQNRYKSDISNSFWPHGNLNISKEPYNQTSNQLISLNIHASPCQRQTQNEPDFDSPSLNSHALRNSSQLGNTFVNDTELTDCDFSSFTKQKNTSASSSQINPCTPRGNFSSSLVCPPENTFNTNVSIDSLTRSSVGDFISSLPGLPSSFYASANKANPDQGRTPHSEASLININIHLSALENADTCSMISKQVAKKVSGIQVNTTGSMSDYPDVRNQNRVLESTSPFSSSAEEWYEGLPFKLVDTADKLKPVTKTILSESSNTNSSADGNNSIFPAQANDCSPHVHCEINNSGNVLTTAKSDKEVFTERTFNENILAVPDSSHSSVKDIQESLLESDLKDLSSTEHVLTCQKSTSQNSCSATDPIHTSSVGNTISTTSTEVIPSLSTNKSLPTVINLDSTAMPTPNSTSIPSNQNKEITPPSSVQNETSKDIKSMHLDIVKSANKIKQCSVFLKRIDLETKIIKSKMPKININNGDTVEKITSSDENTEDCDDAGNDSSLVGDKGDVQTQGRTRTCRTLYPVEVNGYTKPSYNYCRLITQALATAPLRRASGLQICESIAKKHPYYAHLTYPDWRTSIYSALRNRKKFFTLIGSNENNELVWTFNPKFEQYMLEKWVPKYVKEKDQSLSSTICMPWLPKNHPDQPHNAVTRHEPSTSQLSSTSTSEDIGTQVPVIMFSGTLTSSQPASPKIIDCDVLCDEPNLIANENLEKDPLQADNSNPSSPVIQNVCTVTDDFRPWEPEVTVNEDNQRNRKEQNGTQKPNSPSAPIRGATPQTSSRNFTTDYALLSLDEQPTIQKDETVYRANLHKDDTQQNRTQQNETQKSNLPGAVPTGGASPQRSARHTTGDFTLSNLSEKHVIQKDEIFYRVNFNKEHKSIEKFRLHCTVCDEHLGTSSVACRRKVRFHSVLGVLVCTTCYDKTYRAPADTCLWCAKAMMNSVKTCSKCRKLFCERCMQRNFGPVFASKLLENTTLWVCFVCDIKQLWPHRAIAYFLFRHYRYMKRKKYELSKCQPSVQGQADIFTEDLTSCCKGRTIGPNPISNPPLLSTVVAEASTSNNLIPPMIPNSSAMAVASQPSLFLIGDQSSNYIYVQAPNNLPSVTLNTGTQYIHNVFTDRPALPNTITYPLPSEQPVLSPQYQINNPNPLPNCHPSPYSTVTTIPTPHQESSPTTQSNTFPVNPGESILLKAVDNFRPIIMTSSDILGEEAPMLIPDIDIQEENVVASPLMSARERIEQKPMPKSKKQSLLRTVLMSESIESMKRNLQLSSETDPLSVNGNVNTPVTVPSTISNECEQNIEEPILKSIIETATERLINIQNNQNSSNANKNTSQQNRFDNAPVDATIDLCEDEDPLAIPKIKIKTLKELQDPEMFRGFENEESGSAITKLSPETDKPSDKVDIDITDLKQGIIETSRSLIGTQKKFKELAKIISSNLLYKPDQAAELITQFHDILKTCYAELDQIDKNVRQKFGHLTSGNAIASILQSVRKPEEVANPVVQKKKRGRKRKLKHKPNVVVTQPIVEQNVDGSIEDFEEPQNHPRTGNKVTNNTNVVTSDMLPSHSKRKRDLLVFNPLGKVILGSPEITEEDLRMIPDSSDLTDTKQSKPLHNEVYLEEIRRRQYLAQKMAWRKKNIWLSSKRKKNKHKKRSLHITNSPLAYNEEGSLVKKSKKRRKKMFDSDNEDTFYKPTNNQYPKRIRRPSGLSPPLRVSGRKHPSTLLAQLNTASVLKPCSVVIEKLDSKFVELMVRRGKKSNISYEPVFKYINYESDSSNTSST